MMGASLLSFDSLTPSVSSSAVIAIGAATLADIFDPSERGTKVFGILHPTSFLLD